MINIDDLFKCKIHKVAHCQTPECKEIRRLENALGEICTIEFNLVGKQYEKAFKAAARIAAKALGHEKED